LQVIIVASPYLVNVSWLLMHVYFPEHEYDEVKVRETLVSVAVAAVLRVTVVPDTNVTVVPAAIPVPETE
jgi:hypothetical protein